MNKKAFIFSLEAIFALILSVLLTMVIFLSLSSIEQKKSHPDTLNVLSSDLLFELDNSRQMLNESKVSNLLNMILPGQYCARFDVINENDLIELSYTKLGCGTMPSSFVVSKRSYVTKSNFYISRIYMWYNE